MPRTDAMIDDAFVIDAVCHAYNMDPSNHASGRYSDAISELVAGATFAVSPPGYRVPRELYLRDWDVEEMANMLFVESDYDMAVNHVLPLTAYRDGLCSFEKALTIQTRWPRRFITYAGVDPMRGREALEDLHRQVEELPPPVVGLKLYPNSWGPDYVRGWHMDDPQIAFPFFEAAMRLGLKVVAIHKAVPLGPVPMAHYHVADVDRAADAFPDLAFEIVHGGMAFVEETAWQLARFANVYVNLEILHQFVVAKPAAFTQALAGLLDVGGPYALDKIFWGTGCMAVHPRPSLEAFWHRFEFPPERMDGSGIPHMTREAKRKILAENYARMIGLDLASARAGIADDEFARRRRSGLAQPYSTTRVAGKAV